MKINTTRCPYPLGVEFISVLEQEINENEPAKGQAVTLNFHDPGYSAENGGYHPVEIRINSAGGLSILLTSVMSGMALMLN